MPLRFPKSGDRPSGLELLVLGVLAIVVALALLGAWRSTRDGNARPVFGDTAVVGGQP